MVFVFLVLSMEDGSTTTTTPAKFDHRRLHKSNRYFHRGGMDCVVAIIGIDLLPVQTKQSTTIKRLVLHITISSISDKIKINVSSTHHSIVP
jgi:hypothetical protein